MAWHGYALVVVTTPLTNPQKVAIRNRLLELGQSSGALHLITQLRTSLDNQSVIIECNIPAQITKADVAAKIATALGVTVAVVNANTTFQVFDPTDEDTSRAAAAAYLAAHWNEWETAD